MYKLHHLFNFDRSLKVRWLANELNLELSLNQLDAFKKEHLSADFKAINPFSLIPTLEVEADKEEESLTLFENGAICLYLCRLHKPSLIAESDIKFIQWLFFFASTLDQLSGAIIGLRSFGENEIIRKKIEARLPSRLTAMESYLDKKTYWYNNEFSLLDIFAWQNLAYLYCDNQLTPYPNLQRYVIELATRPALQKLNPEGLLYPTN